MIETTGVLTPRPPRWRWMLAVAAYFCAVCLGHLPFSLWLVRGRAITLDGQTYSYAYSHAVPWLAVAAVAALACHLWSQARRHRPFGPAAAYWLLWAVCVFLVDRYLTYSANEYAHYPQYAFLAWLIARLTDPSRTLGRMGRIIFWTTLLGMVDESMQYLWTTRSYSNYLDFNDFLANLLAAAAGAMLYYGGARPLPHVRKPAIAEWSAALAIAGLVCLCLSTGRIDAKPAAPSSSPIHAQTGFWRLDLQNGPGHYGAWFPGKRHAAFFVLPPWAGLSLMLAAGVAFARYPEKWGRRKRHGASSALPGSPAACTARETNPPS